jgi:tetratricopeptide (TPR) repeat protein
MDRMILKEAKANLKAGNTQGAINNVQEVLRLSPNNFMAKRLLKKIKTQLLKEAKKSIEAGNFKEAVDKLDALQKLDPQNEEATAMYADAKKQILLGDAKEALTKDNPLAALNMLNEALRLDPKFQEAKALQGEASKKAEEKIANLVTTANELVEQKEFEKLRALAQDILTIDPQNAQAADLLREAQAQILSRDKEQNLSDAQKFFDQGMYESALSKAEEVLKVDPNSQEAKQLLEKSKAEISKPQLRLTGLTEIKGMQFANITIPSTGKKFTVKQGETFGDFKVSAIDMDLKAVVVTYVKTGSQLTITTTPEGDESASAPPEGAAAPGGPAAAK